jgi:antitoxin component of RelBE/YafQ-DinJ toxin-antitoxin module
MDPVSVHLEPATTPDEFQTGDIYISYIAEAGGAERSILVRLDDADRLLARVIREGAVPVQVLIGRQQLKIDENATNAALAALEERRQQEAEEREREEEAQRRQEEIERIQRENMEALYDAIPWEYLEESQHEQAAFSLTVELSREDNAWIVTLVQEAPEPGVLAAVSAWVLMGAVFAALVLSIILSVLRGRR